MYLSPQFYGFDFGVSYEPSTAAIGGDNGSGCNGALNSNGGNSVLPGGSSTATPGCDQLGATSTGDIIRRQNTYEALGRYRGTFGAFGVVATAAYVGSGRVTTTASSARRPTRSAFASRTSAMATSALL